jgi:phage terminase large subunit-like protein
MCSNVMLSEDSAGNIKIDKAKSKEKVDGMVATVMALGEKLTDETVPFIYNERGIREI